MTTCEKCHQETEFEISAEIAAHDDNEIDVVATCPECGARLNGFLSLSMMVWL